MSHLVCKKHNRRVMTFEGKVIHRSDGSHCKGAMRQGNVVWRVFGGVPPRLMKTRLNSSSS